MFMANGVQRLPDAAGEAAYAAQVFPPIVSYFTGWMMLLAYFIVCPWEAVAVGKLAAYIFPSLNSFELYRVAGQPVFLPRLVLGVGLTVFLAVLNYRGIRWSASFQNWTTAIGASSLCPAPGYQRRSRRSCQFSSGVPHDSLRIDTAYAPDRAVFHDRIRIGAQSGGGSSSRIPLDRIFRAIMMAVLVGAGFYVLAVAAVAYVAPWQGLIGKRFATAIAFEQALGAQWPVRLILIMALFGLFQCFNGNFVASSRLLFAYGRRRTISPRFGEVHEKFLTPSVAILGITAGTLAGLLLGDALLVPVTEVGSMAVRPRLAGSVFVVLAGREEDFSARRYGTWDRRVAVTFLMKVLPVIPGHFFARRMDCLRHLGCSRRHPPSPAPASLRCRIELLFGLFRLESLGTGCIPARNNFGPNEKPTTSKCVSM